MTTVYTDLNNTATPRAIDTNLLNMSWKDAAKPSEERLQAIQNMFNNLKRDEDIFVSQDVKYHEKQVI